MYNISCSEIWGGIQDEDVDACASGIDISLYSSAANGGKGGDIYYISACSGDYITRVAIADVTGHGEIVSSISQWLYEGLRNRMNAREGNLVLAELNALAHERGYHAMTTAAIVAFRADNSKLEFSYAGHPPMFIYRRQVKHWETVTLGSPKSGANLPIGAFPYVTYDQERIPIAAGDRIFLYTDGVIESACSEGRCFGRERLLACLEEAAEDTLHDLKMAVRDALHDHAGGSLEHDDVTIMALEVRSGKALTTAG